MDIAKLALEDGTVFTGAAFGARGEVDGEVVFNTSMTGYQEILTDPSYHGQIVTMTYPQIGNYGVNEDDDGITLRRLLGELQAAADPSRPVPIITVGMGPGADEEVPFTPRPPSALGAHNLRFGTIISRTAHRGEFLARPVEITDLEGRLLRRIEFAGGGRYERTDIETAFFAQDNWVLGSRLAFNLGGRFERQRISQAWRIAPRGGVGAEGDAGLPDRTGPGRHARRI